MWDRMRNFCNVANSTSAFTPFSSTVATSTLRIPWKMSIWTNLMRTMAAKTGEIQQETSAALLLSQAFAHLRLEIRQQIANVLVAQTVHQPLWHDRYRQPLTLKNVF